MALIFPILTQFDDRAAKKADKTFGALGKKFAAVFSVAAVVKFGKESVKAFADAEREAAMLRAQLEAVNLGFASPLVEEYIDNLELLSGKTGDELVRSFNALSQATLDVTTAQELLNLSLDVAAGTGKSLSQVAGALQRAYKGETTALARLRIGYTTAELKGKDFSDVVEELQKKFEGAAADAADTFAGKMARLTAAMDQAKEAFGRGFVQGIDNAGMSIEDFQKQLIDLGEEMGKVAFAATEMVSGVVNAFDDLRQSSAVQELLNVFDAVARGLYFVVQGELLPSREVFNARQAGEERRRNEESNRATLRQRAALARAEKKITAERDKQLKLTDREKKAQAQLDKAKKMFDMEQIQIQAALQGKITEEERTRLKLMQAILDENGTEADRLTEKLQKLQSDTERLASSLVSLKAGDPFEEWDDYFASAGNMIDELFKKLQGLALSIDKLLTESLSTQANRQGAVIFAQEEKVIAFGEAAKQTEEMARIAAEQAAKAIAEALAAQAAAQSAAEKAAADAFLEAAKAAAEAATVLADSVIAAYEAEALAAAELATELEFEAMAAVAASPQIIVNVQGNVTTQDDLVEAITDQLYQYQKTGKGLLFSSVAI